MGKTLTNFYLNLVKNLGHLQKSALKQLNIYILVSITNMLIALTILL